MVWVFGLVLLVLLFGFWPTLGALVQVFLLILGILCVIVLSIGWVVHKAQLESERERKEQERLRSHEPQPPSTEIEILPPRRTNGSH